MNAEEEASSIPRRLRRDIIRMAEHSAHVAVALSCVDILAALYAGVLRRDAEPADVFLLSKGHGAMALYAVLAWAGYFDQALLDTYGADGSMLAEHPLANKTPGIAFAAGSLGHGLPVAAGIAKGFKLQGSPARVYVLLGDGECDEGSVWEAAALASAQRLDNLTAIVDWNGLQACGECKDISGIYRLVDVWRGFGWHAEEADGHDFVGLQSILKPQDGPEKPRAILCRTVKGKGVPFMEGDLEWHYRPVRGADREAALRHLTDA